MHSEVMAVVTVLLKSIYSDVMKGSRDRLNGLCVLTCGAAMFDPKILRDMMAVSYTHLDVYKRQPKNCISLPVWVADTQQQME